MPDASRKKLIYVSEDVLERLARLAYARGESLAKLLDRVLRQVVEAFDMGYNMEELINLLKVVEVEKKLGAVFVPHEVVETLLEKTGGTDDVRRVFYEAGRAYGLYIRNRYRGSLDIVRSFLEKTRWDLNEVSVVEQGDSYKLMCVSTVMGEVETNMTASFIEGLLAGLGYSILREEVSKGIIVVEFKA
ncbi:hypothetical protein [Thermogladius sp.]|uniref:hypothetical protein n=1 Tax=Thermogladius sp. TaxID=2023064 RepID=UPI003D09B729